MPISMLFVIEVNIKHVFRMPVEIVMWKCLEVWNIHKILAQPEHEPVLDNFEELICQEP